MKNDAKIEKGCFIKLFAWETAKKKYRERFDYSKVNAIMGINKKIWDYIATSDTIILVEEIKPSSVFCTFIATYGARFNLYIPKCAIKAITIWVKNEQDLQEE